MTCSSIPAEPVDEESLTMDAAALRKKRLGRLMGTDSKELSKLDKLKAFRERFRVPLVWRTLLGVDDPAGIPDGKIASLNKVHIGIWQVRVIVLSR